MGRRQLGRVALPARPLPLGLSSGPGAGSDNAMNVASSSPTTITPGPGSGTGTNSSLPGSAMTKSFDGADPATSSFSAMSIARTRNTF